MSKKPFIIVVGLDYAEHSDIALVRAFELASRDAAAEVHVISVLPTVHASPLAPMKAQIEAEAASMRLKGHVEAKLHAFSAALTDPAAKPPRLVVSHIRFDLPANGIAQLASDLDADLVVVGTHGREGVARLLLGSVSEAVLHLAPCPVLIMRPKTTYEEPVIEPPCPRCVEVRETSGGTELWCEQHREKHGRRHTYHQSDLAGAETNFPLVNS